MHVSVLSRVLCDCHSPIAFISPSCAINFQLEQILFKINVNLSGCQRILDAILLFQKRYELECAVNIAMSLLEESMLWFHFIHTFIYRCCCCFCCSWMISPFWPSSISLGICVIFSFRIDPFILHLFSAFHARNKKMDWNHIKTIWSRYLWMCSEKCDRTGCNRQMLFRCYA